MRHLSRLLLLALVLLAGAGAARAEGKPPLVLAAASLQEVLTEVADAWARSGHARPVLSFAASSALARQVEAGAPADIFLSADEQWMDYLAARRLLRDGTRATLLGNRLVLVQPAEGKARLTVERGFPLARALGSGRLAIADPDAVPAGRYAKAALQSLGVWSSVAGRLATAENVRAALALVERGQAPLGIVYATDAIASRGVRVVDDVPADAHPPITYPVALLQASTSPDAESFRRFLLSREVKPIFMRRGFELL